MTARELTDAQRRPRVADIPGLRTTAPPCVRVGEVRIPEAFGRAPSWDRGVLRCLGALRHRGYRVPSTKSSADGESGAGGRRTNSMTVVADHGLLCGGRECS